MQSDDKRCDKCNDSLFEHNGEYYCPSCDNIEGFTLDANKEEFEL